MSLEQVKIILQRALDDQAYYDLLMSKTEEALRGYNLSEPEAGMLRGLSAGPYTQARRGLLETKRLVEAAQQYSPPTP